MGGALEMMTFFFIINTGVAVLCAIFYYLLYMITENVDLLFQVHIHGLSGYLAGVSIAVKQVMPDHVLARTPLGKITNRHIPLTVFGLTFILWALGAVEGSYCTILAQGSLSPGSTLGSIRCTATGQRATWRTVLPSPPCSQMFFNPL